MPENKGHSNREFLDFFRSTLSGMSAESVMRYRRTISELEIFLVGHRVRLADLSERLVADWATELLCRGLAKSTVVRHLDSLNAMVKNAAKEGLIAPNNAARSVSKSLSTIKNLPVLLSGSAFEGCLAILRNALKEREGNAHNAFQDMVLFAMLNGASGLDTVALVKKKNLPEYNGMIRAILMRNVDSRRDYVFDLHQSALTSRQLKSAISAGVLSVFSHYIDEAGFDPDGLVRSMWAACAMRSGLTASEALAYAGGPAPYAVPEFCHQSTVNDDGKSSWIATVNSMLASEMPQWYVMQMRRGVSYDELRKEIYDKIHPCPMLYYPCETILKQRGDKRSEVERPYIDRTVFFKSDPEKVMPMFSTIGDKAWCYRVLSVPGAPYAVVPLREMERFQRAIGMFTPDIEIHPLGALTPMPGETVVLIKAGFNNRTATVEDIINKECGSAIFRVKLNTDNGYEFRIDVDARQIERIG